MNLIKLQEEYRDRKGELNDILPTLKVAHFVRNPRFARSGVSSYDFIQMPETQSYLYAGCS